MQATFRGYSQRVSPALGGTLVLEHIGSPLLTSDKAILKSECCCHMPQKKTAKRVLDRVKHRGLSVLSVYEVSILLRHHAEGAVFATAFKKRKVCSL